MIMLLCILTLLVLSKGSTLIAVSNLRPLRRDKEQPSGPSGNDSWATNQSETVSYAMSTTDHSTARTMAMTTEFEVSKFYQDMQCKHYTQVMYENVKRANGSFFYTRNYTVDFTKCVAIPLDYSHLSDSGDGFSCLSTDNYTGNVTWRDTYYADQCFVSRNYWAWSLLLMICVPHFFVFLRCLWRVFFKNKKSPTWQAMLFVVVTETLYSAGVV